VKLSKAQTDKVADAIRSFADFNQCPDILIKKTNNRNYAKAFRDRW
jgi:hypothetical protein